MVSSDHSPAEYRQRRRVYKRQCRIGIFSVGLIAFCLVAAKASVSNNNSRITNAKRSRRDIDNLDSNTEETPGIKWYKEPPFNLLESELADNICTQNFTECFAKVPTTDFKNIVELEDKCKEAVENVTSEESSGHGSGHGGVKLWSGNRGADIFLCIFGTLWLFVAVAIICDDFFVPSLEAISEVLDLSEDVAGATFMAAGSSAPELFTSLAAATSESDVGVGTIVGSAVFNLLVIVALSAALSGKVLNLDWRPLARDATFYTLSIAILIIFAWDGMVEWFEATILVLVYLIYVGTMFFNEKLMAKLIDLEEAMKKCCSKKVASEGSEPRESRRGSHSRFMNTSRATQQSVIGKKNSGASISKVNSDGSVAASESEDEKLNLTPCISPDKWYSLTIGLEKPSMDKDGVVGVLKLVFDWFLFVLSLPFYVLYTLTIPPCGTPETRKWYLPSFIMAIGWIVAISFGMLECVEHLGEILEINHFTMGLVIIAVGTSIPDALSSVLVAKEGFGDMAVSNAIGSNVFDINLGLGLPFLIFTCYKREPVSLLKSEQWCVISSLDYPIRMLPHVKFGFVLFAILALTLMIFSFSKFKLESKTGMLLFLTYIIFLAYSFTQEMVCRSYDC